MSWLTVCHFACVLLGESGGYDTLIRTSLKQEMCAYFLPKMWKIESFKAKSKDFNEMFEGGEVKQLVST